MIRVMLVKEYCSEISEENAYSVEAGYADNIRHFDHHGKWSNYPAPCNNDRILEIQDEEDAYIYITHLDADCFVGIMRMIDPTYVQRLQTNGIRFDVMEKIDLNGSSVVDITNATEFTTYAYMIGFSEYVRSIGFPRCEAKPRDVTEYIERIMEVYPSELIQMGKETMMKVEDTYRNCLVKATQRVGLWAIDKDDAFNPSRPYRDGIDVVIVYRKHYKSISIYCNPESEFEFAGKTVDGIEFAGHPKACGSPRGKKFKIGDAVGVFIDIAKMVVTADME